MSSISTISTGHVSVPIFCNVFTVFNRDAYSLLEQSVIVASRVPHSVCFSPDSLTVLPQCPLLAGFLFSNSPWCVVLMPSTPTILCLDPVV